MLSYRHLFHAGNHADVLKHVVLYLCLDYLTQKDKPFVYIDTHAGAGLYDLQAPWAQKNREYETGIARLWQRTDLPAALQGYHALVQAGNPAAQLRYYPGSPWLARQVLRPTDQLRLYELHTAEYQALCNLFVKASNVNLNQQDGFAALKAVLPPAQRRGLILIDPPYEVKQDYQQVVTALRQALERFASGTYLIWYPVVSRSLLQTMLSDITAMAAGKLLQFELCVSSRSAGMNRSGMLVVNPPWVLAEQMQVILPYLADRLGTDTTASWALNSPA